MIMCNISSIIYDILHEYMYIYMCVISVNDIDIPWIYYWYLVILYMGVLH